MRSVLVVGLTALVVLAALAVRVAWRAYRLERSALRPSRHRVARPETDDLRGLEDVTLGRPEAARTRGWFLPPRNGAAIVLTHGSGADRLQVVPQAAALARCGFGVLLFDWPGHGESEGVRGVGEPEREALRSAFDLLASKGIERVGAFGFSLGAWVVAQVAPGDPRVAAVVLEGAPTDLVEQTRYQYRRWGPLTQWPALLALRDTGFRSGPRPSATLSRLAPRPVLLVAGARDEAVPAWMSEELYRAASSPRELWIVPAAAHGDVWAIAGAEYARRIECFFRDALLPS